MALITCKDCKKEYSTDANSCPHCGAKQPSKSNKTPAIVLFLLIGVPLIGAITGGEGSRDSETKNPQNYALSYCRDFTKSSVHDPSSVEFDRIYPKPTVLPDNKYKMIISLRAKNGFGTMRHFAVECTVRFNGDSWSLVDLKEVN